MNLPRTSSPRRFPPIEALEARIAPASIGASTISNSGSANAFEFFDASSARTSTITKSGGEGGGGPEVTIVNKHLATFTDADGDLVKITVSSGRLDKSDFVLRAAGLGADLVRVNFSDDSGEFARTNLTITANHQIVPGSSGVFQGNGFVNVGFINSTGADLGKVSIKGDLGQISAGLPGSARPALKSLTAQSMGAFGLATQEIGGSLSSDFAGNVGKITVKSDLDGVTLAATGSIAKVKVRGSIVGGQISAGTTLGKVIVRGDIVGTDAARVLITAFGNASAPTRGTDLAIGSLSVGGGVEFLRVLAGFDRARVGLNADASIGSLSVGGDWHASTVLTGAAAGPDGFEGTTDDIKLPFPARDSARIVSGIARIAIGGQAYGTLAVGDSFGIVTEKIGALKVGGAKFRLERGAQSPGDFFPLGATVPGPNGLPSDFSIGEIVSPL